MGKTANLSPLGLYEWDNSLFDLMLLPSAIDRETLVMNLLAETAELEVLYPNPTVMKNIIGVWSAKEKPIWDKLYATTQYDYNPIENYNRYEDGSTSGSGSTVHSGTDSRSDTHTEGGTETDTLTETATTNGTDVTNGEKKSGHWIAGFDSLPESADDDGLVKQTRDFDETLATREYDEENNRNGTNTTAFGKTINETGSLTHGENIETTNEGEHTLHAHGNIGVTTTQKLIREQRDVDRFNIYDIIIEDFKMRFCILIY